MKNTNSQLLKELKSLIQNEIKSNKTIKAKIIKINSDIIEVSTTTNTSLRKDTPIEINRTPATIVNISKKIIAIKINKQVDFRINQEVNLKNIQQDIIIKKLQETYDNINENNLNESNQETLNIIVNTTETSFNNNKYNISKKLNNNQYQAVKNSLQAKKFHIIKGPSGTGKTHTIIEIIKLLHKENRKILITTHTHIALDNILERLSSISDKKILRIGQEEKISQKNVKYSLKEHVINHPSYNLILEKKQKIKQLKNETDYKKEDNKDKKYIDKILRLIFPIRKKEKLLYNYEECDENFENIDRINEINKEIENIEENIQNDILRNVNIIASTIISSNSFITHDLEFDYVLMDEASQVPLYLALIPLLKTNKFILIGDDKQLQPITNKNASYFLNKSIFNLLINKYPENYSFLNIQYRMNQEICNVASKLYYNNKLLTGDKNKSQKITLNDNNSVLLNEDPITLIDTSNCNYHENNVSTGCCNKIESSLILHIIKSLKSNGISEDEIGVITPYKKQKQYIKKVFHEYRYNVECDTIYRFQGREKDVIIISFCKSSKRSLSIYQKKFLADKNQLNVSITRSRKKLIIICNYSMLRSADNIQELVKEITPSNIIYLEDFN